MVGGYPACIEYWNVGRFPSIRAVSGTGMWVITQHMSAYALYRKPGCWVVTQHPRCISKSGCWAATQHPRCIGHSGCWASRMPYTSLHLRRILRWCQLINTDITIPPPLPAISHFGPQGRARERTLSCPRPQNVRRWIMVFTDSRGRDHRM